MLLKASSNSKNDTLGGDFSPLTKKLPAMSLVFMTIPDVQHSLVPSRLHLRGLKNCVLCTLKKIPNSRWLDKQGKIFHDVIDSLPWTRDLIEVDKVPAFSHDTHAKDPPLSLSLQMSSALCCRSGWVMFYVWAAEPNGGTDPSWVRNGCAVLCDVLRRDPNGWGCSAVSSQWCSSFANDLPRTGIAVVVYTNRIHNIRQLCQEQFTAFGTMAFDMIVPEWTFHMLLE